MVTDSLIYPSMWHLHICVSQSSSHLCLMMDWIQTMQDVLQHAKLMLSGLIVRLLCTRSSFIQHTLFQDNQSLFYRQHFMYKEMIAQKPPQLSMMESNLTVVCNILPRLSMLLDFCIKVMVSYILLFTGLYLIVKTSCKFQLTWSTHITQGFVVCLVLVVFFSSCCCCLFIYFGLVCILFCFAWF